MRYPLSTVLDEIPPSGIREFFDLVLGAKDIISLGVGEPDFTTPEVARKAAIESIEAGNTSYTSNSGLMELRETISNYLSSRYAVQYNPSEEILITTGVSEGIDITLRSILNPGDEVILPEPCYVSYTAMIKLAGGKVAPVDTTGHGFLPDPTLLEAAITPKTKALFLTSPSNPTGRVIPLEMLEAIRDLAVKHDLWVISDEIYSELCYDKAYTSLASIDGMKDRTILLNGVSKGFAMTGWRIGYIAAPKDIIERTLKIHQYSALCAPIMSQVAANVALKETLPEVDKMRDSFRERRDLCLEKFKEMGVDIHEPEGAFYCFPSVEKFGLSSSEFCLRLLKEHKVATVPGSAFGKCGEGYIRICYAIDKKNLTEALNRMKAFVGSIL